MAEEAYRSLYGDLTRLKDASLLDDPAAGTGADAALFRLLLAVSEAVDRYCNRHFYALTAPRRFDGPGDATLNLPDVIAVHSLRSDDDEDGVYETEWGASDYDLLPLNADSRAHWGGPHHAVRARGNGLRPRFERGQARYQVTAVWGYREYLEPSGSTVRSTLSDSATTLSVDDGRDFAVGQTIAVSDERMLVTGIASSSLSVTRGLNGTQATNHASRIGVSLVRWPSPVERATLINTARLWTRAPAFEPFYVDSDLDTDVRLLLEPYRLGGG